MARARSAGHPRGRPTEDPTSIFLARQRAPTVAVTGATSQTSCAHHGWLVNKLTVLGLTFLVASNRNLRLLQICAKLVVLSGDSSPT